MALHSMTFSFSGEKKYKINRDWSHTGVVGSGDMEVLFKPLSQGDGNINVSIVTPVRGFDDIWQKVLERFIKETNIGNVDISINDNNSTPFVVATRLKQALIELEEGA